VAYVCLAGALLISAGFAVAAAHAAPAAKRPIVIGFIGALSGPNAQDNASMLNVEKQVAETVNAKGGVAGHQIQIISEDDHADPAQARVLALKMVQEEHVDALAGPLFSTEAISVAQISNQLQVPIVALQASVEAVVYPNGRDQPPYPWVFASGVSATTQMAKLMQYAAKKKWTRVAVVVQNDAFGTTDLPEFLDTAKQLKLRVVVNRAIDANAADATPQAVAIQGANVQAVLAWTNPVATAALIKSMRANGVTAPVLANISNNNPTFYTLAGSNANGVIATGYKVAYTNGAAASAFSAAFQQKWGFPLRSNFFPVIDGIKDYFAAVALAAKPAKGKKASPDVPSPKKVRLALQKVVYKGLSEKVAYTAKQHDVYDASALIMTVVQNGQAIALNN
jgi:branched-chain amino acid transport system substrate-binding protein